MDFAVARNKQLAVEHSADEKYVVRLRGLPFSQHIESDIETFFTGLHILDIKILTSRSGKPQGEALVQFSNRDMLYKALKMHKKTIGTRYIEVYQSNMKSWDFFKDKEHVIKAEGLQYERSEQWRDPNTVCMKGLPYSANTDQIKQFL